jgi:hypothetical protein
MQGDLVHHSLPPGPRQDYISLGHLWVMLAILALPKQRGNGPGPLLPGVCFIQRGGEVSQGSPLVVQDQAPPSRKFGRRLDNEGAVLVPGSTLARI